MYANEILFVDKFLAKLKMLHVESIPFRTKEYRDGVHAMKQYFDEHIHSLSEALWDIGLLFINDGQQDFADAIMEGNGERISLQNPRLEKATILMSEKRAQLGLEDDSLGLPDSFITEITKAFCAGANVPV